MKRMSVALIALAFSAGGLNAQAIELSGGLNFSKLSSSEIQGAAQNAGMIFGLDVVLPLGPIGLNLGADWSQEGVEQSVDNEVSVIDLSYVEVPVHLRFPIVGAGPARLNLILGPSLGINTGCEITANAGAVESCADVVDGGFEAEKLEWAGVGGLGVSLGVGSVVYAGADLKYTVGLSNVSAGSSLDAKNRTFTLTTHIGFGIF